MMRLLLIALAFLHSDAPVIEIQAKLSSEEIRLAEPFQVVYRINTPEGYSLDLSSWKASSTQWGEFTLWDFKIHKEGSATELSVSLVPFEIGPSKIPNLNIPFKAGFDQAQSMAGQEPIPTLATPEIPVVILDPTAQSKTPPALRDIKQPRRPLYFWEHPLGMAAIGLLILMLAAGLAMLWWARRKIKKKEEKEPEETLSPEDAFLRDLSSLEQSGLGESRLYREFHFALSALFRKYLGRRFLLDTESLTSGELIRILHAQREACGIELGSLLKLKESLEISDLIKFAKYQPEFSEQAKAVEILRNFVETHRPPPVQTAPNGVPAAQQ